MEFTRYAIWWVPRSGTALARFGAEWTGWCAETGVAGARRALAALSRPRAGVPGAARLTGLHATLRPAFRPAPGRSRWALEGALAELAARTGPVRLPRLRLGVEDGRVVVAPMRPDEGVTRLVTAVAEAMRPFGVAPSFAAVAGRGSVAAGGLVLPDRPAGAAFAPAAPVRFRLALTDRLDAAEALSIVAELTPTLAPVLVRSQCVAALALVGDPGRGRPWRLLERFALDGEAAQRGPRLPAAMDCCGPRLMAPLGDRAAA